MQKVVLQAEDLDGYLTHSDHRLIARMDAKYSEAMALYPQLSTSMQNKTRDSLISLYNEMGDMMQEITEKESNIHVYSFETPVAIHGEASRLIAKLRDVRTENPEFVY